MTCRERVKADNQKYYKNEVGTKLEFYFIFSVLKCVSAEEGRIVELKKTNVLEGVYILYCLEGYTKATDRGPF